MSKHRSTSEWHRGYYDAYEENGYRGPNLDEEPESDYVIGYNEGLTDRYNDED
jgi:hypothetical protein